MEMRLGSQVGLVWTLRGRRGSLDASHSTLPRSCSKGLCCAGGRLLTSGGADEPVTDDPVLDDVGLDSMILR